MCTDIHIDLVVYPTDIYIDHIVYTDIQIHIVCTDIHIDLVVYHTHIYIDHIILHMRSTYMSVYVQIISHHTLLFSIILSSFITYEINIHVCICANY